MEMPACGNTICNLKVCISSNEWQQVELMNNSLLSRYFTQTLHHILRDCSLPMSPVFLGHSFNEVSVACIQI